jgi:choline transport protein
MPPDWVSEFGPAYAQKQLSYIVGWLCLLGWQVGNTAIGYLCGTILQGMVALNNPSYEPTRWQAVLIIWAVLTFSLVFNTFLAGRLPLLEGVVLVIHVCGFFAILIVLWVLADTDPASEVFTSFYNGGGWPSQGTACLVGILSPVFSFVGPDAATYMAEELRDASRSLPRAMIWTALVNGGMGFVMIITFMMMLGDPEVALDSPTGYPFIDVSLTPNRGLTALCSRCFQLFYRTTGSLAATTVMVSLFFIMLLFGCVTSFATSSRQMWAFVSTYHPACQSVN